MHSGNYGGGKSTMVVVEMFLIYCLYISEINYESLVIYNGLSKIKLRKRIKKEKSSLKVIHMMVIQWTEFNDLRKLPDFKTCLKTSHWAQKVNSQRY